MSINLDNYEYFFLLYADNELNETERKSVMDFVQLHPQFAAALHTLQQLKLPLENTFSFPDKSVLYKAAGAGINLNNYEAFFLSYADNELSITEREDTERFVLQHPQLQEEFMILQRAKLPAEIIECPDKQNLYKRNKRIRPLYIGLLAMAAMLAGVVVLVLQPHYNGDKTAPVAVIKKVNHTQPTGVSIPNKTIIISPQAQTDSNQKVVAANKPKPVNKVQQTPVNKTEFQDKKEPEITVQVKPLPLVLQQLPPDENTNDNNAVIAQAKQPQLKPLEEINADNSSDTKVVYAADDNINVQPAVYKELNTDEDDNTLHVALLQLNKAKVNSLFKKAAHLLGGKAKEQRL